MVRETKSDGSERHRVMGQRDTERRARETQRDGPARQSGGLEECKLVLFVPLLEVFFGPPWYASDEQPLHGHPPHSDTT